MSGYDKASRHTFVKMLDTLLPDTQIINLAFPGYSSLQGLKLLQLLGYWLSPDIIVIAFNFNDRRYVLNETQQDKHKNMYWTIAWWLIRRLFPLPYLRKLKKKLFKNPKEKIIDLDEVYLRVTPLEYKKNLIKLASLSRHLGAKPLFLILNDNPSHTGFLNQSQKTIPYDNLENIKLILEQAIKNNTENWFNYLARIQLAKIYRETNKSKIQDTLLNVKHFNSIYGGYPIRMDVEYNYLMFEAAKETHTTLVRIGPHLNQFNDSYSDFCHLTHSGHQRAAHLLLQAIQSI